MKGAADIPESLRFRSTLKERQLRDVKELYRSNFFPRLRLEMCVLGDSANHVEPCCFVSGFDLQKWSFFGEQPLAIESCFFQHLSYGTLVRLLALIYLPFWEHP